MTDRHFAEPYEVDPDDRATRGRLLHAAASGDKRARLTLRKMPKPDRDRPEPRTGAVARGRDLYRGITRPVDDTETTSEATTETSDA